MFLNYVSPLILYDVERGMTSGPMQGKCYSSRVDLGYTELFCVREVTLVFFSSYDSVLGDSLEFHQANGGSLPVCLAHGIALHTKQGNRASSLGEGEVSWVFSSRGRNLGYILEIWPG